MKRARLLLLLPVCVFAGACSLLSDADSGCDERQPYQSAQETAPLRVPDGALPPDTRNALPIPQVTASEYPQEKGRCLDHPPVYSANAQASASGASPSTAGVAAPASDSGALDFGMNGGRAWETRLGVTYQLDASADFEGGTTAEFASSTGFMVGVGYDLTRHFEIGANFSFDQRSYDANIAGDVPGEVFPVSGRLDSLGVLFDLTYNFMTGPLTPFLVTGIGWNWVDTQIATQPPQIGCWWNPWYGYVCTSFQDTKTFDGLTYQLGAGLRYHLNDSFSLSGSYRMSWVDFANATSTPTFDGLNLILGWRF
jgi:opacity protein-like surface antigen